MKKKNKTIKLSSAKNKMIPLHAEKEFTITNEKLQPVTRPGVEFASEKSMLAKLKAVSTINVNKISNYLILSAKTPYTPNKGFVNALNCQAMFPDGPNIDFPWWTPQNQSLPTAGKIEIWLTDLENGKNLTVEIRSTGYSASSESVYEIRSSITPGLYGYFPVKVDSKIDLYFPNIQTEGMELISMEAIHMEGSWVFFDAKINLVE
ncbi:MAG: hypothetical protein ABI462_10820 [Ignavibacteria bacterium]